MNDSTILALLLEKNLWGHEVAKACNVELGDALITLAKLANDDKVQRLKSGAWALTNPERNRRRRRAGRRPGNAPDISPAHIPNVAKDPMLELFPRPPYETPDVGFFG